MSELVVWLVTGIVMFFSLPAWPTSFYCPACYLSQSLTHSSAAGMNEASGNCGVVLYYDIW